MLERRHQRHRLSRPSTRVVGRRVGASRVDKEARSAAASGPAPFHRCIDGRRGTRCAPPTMPSAILGKWALSFMIGAVVSGELVGAPGGDLGAVRIASGKVWKWTTGWFEPPCLASSRLRRSREAAAEGVTLGGGAMRKPASPQAALVGAGGVPEGRGCAAPARCQSWRCSLSPVSNGAGSRCSWWSLLVLMSPGGRTPRGQGVIFTWDPWGPSPSSRRPRKAMVPLAGPDRRGAPRRAGRHGAGGQLVVAAGGQPHRCRPASGGRLAQDAPVFGPHRAAIAAARRHRAATGRAGWRRPRRPGPRPQVDRHAAVGAAAGRGSGSAGRGGEESSDGNGRPAIQRGIMRAPGRQALSDDPSVGTGILVGPSGVDPATKNRPCGVHEPPATSLRSHRLAFVSVLALGACNI